MSNANSTRQPSYRQHKASGQAVVTIDGKDIYLGRYGTPASKAAYDRTIKEWLGNGLIVSFLCIRVKPAQILEPRHLVCYTDQNTTTFLLVADEVARLIISSGARTNLIGGCQ